MENLRSLLDKIFEALKGAIAQQAESKYVLAIREKYQELSPLGQRITVWTTVSLVALLILYFPFSNLMEAMDQSEKFNQKRQSLRELLRVVKEVSGAPTMRPVPSEGTLKTQVEGIFTQSKIRPEQMKSEQGRSPNGFNKVQTSALGYRLERLTLRQLIDTVFAIEQMDAGTRVTDIQMNADTKDPHYYMVQMNIVSFGPKVAQGIAAPVPDLGNKKAPSKPTKSGQEDEL